MKKTSRRLIAPLLFWLSLTGQACPLSAHASAAPGCTVPRGFITRPDPTGVPTKVMIGLFLIDLRWINDTEQSFNADLFVSISWKDPRLVSEAQLAGCRLSLNDVWHPRVQVVNERSLSKRLPELVTIDSQGTVGYQQRYQGEFTAPLSLREFPLDTHRIDIEIVSVGFGPDEVAFVVAEEMTGRSEVLTIAEWTVSGGGTRIEPLYVAPRKRNISRIIYEAEVSRKVGYYVWKVLVPLSLIVLMSWAVFWISPAHVAPRIGSSTSAVLTLIAFQFSLGYMLPRLSYLTRADRLLMGSTLLVFLAFGASLLTILLAGQGQETLSRRINLVARWLFPAAFLVVLTVSFRL